MNPARSKAWGIDSFLFFPNFMLLVWSPNWYLTYHYWPTSYNTHIFEGTLYFVPPRNARERLQQELAAVTFKEYALQDGNTLEATQSMLESRAVTQFPLERPGDPAAPAAHDRPRLRGRLPEQARRRTVRVGGHVLTKEYKHGHPARESSPTSNRSPTGASSSSASGTPSGSRAPWTEMQAFYDAAFPRLEAAMEYLDQYALDALPDDATHLLWLCYSLVNVSFPVEVWRQPRVPDSGAASIDVVVEPAV